MSGGRAWACLLCPTAPDGYAGFETGTSAGLLSHMRAAHELGKEQVLTAKAEQQMHLSMGNGGSRSSANYRLPDGRLMAATIRWWTPDKKPRAKAKRRRVAR